MFKNRKLIVKLSEKANETYELLLQNVEKEDKKGINSSFHQTLLISIERAISSLKQNPFSGNQVPKSLIPDKYKRLYDSENIWRIELSDFWRLIYTIHGNQLEIISFILDIFDHKEYNKIFGYK